MSSIRESLHKELRVAFSPRSQPIWFRVLKWTVLLAVVRRYRGTDALRRWSIGGGAAGLGVHMLYRHKTQAWTHPWGGWDDLAAARGGSD